MAEATRGAAACVQARQGVFITAWKTKDHKKTAGTSTIAQVTERAVNSGLAEVAARSCVLWPHGLAPIWAFRALTVHSLGRDVF